MIKTMGDLLPTDQVLGTDKKYHTITLLPIQRPLHMYRLYMKIPNMLYHVCHPPVYYAQCSNTHEWTFYDSINQEVILTTQQMFNTHLSDVRIGSPDGPILMHIRRALPKKVRCIVVHDTNNHLFEIILNQTQTNVNYQKKHRKFLSNRGGIRIFNIMNGDTIYTLDNKPIHIIKVINSRYKKIYVCDNGTYTATALYLILTKYERTVYTHNCRERFVCGPLPSIASHMALDNNDATTIPSHPGAGMVKAQTETTTIQYYYAKPSWIEKWYTDRGFTTKGYELHNDSNSEDGDNLGEDEDINLESQQVQIKFGGFQKNVDNNHEQTFEEI